MKKAVPILTRGGGKMRVNSKELAVKITPTGDIYFLYNDEHPLRDLGKMELQRASNVEWDAEEQKWVVWINETGNEGPKRKRLIQTFKNRADAIEAEISILNERLANGVAVEELFNG
jgi:hypothetical protein